MFKAPEEFAYDKPNVDSTNKEYRVGVNDYLHMEIYTNGGALLIQYTTSNVDFIRSMAAPEMLYLVDVDGNVQLPALGKVRVLGMTVAEIQKYLENAYSNQFKEPYCIVKVMNKRVVIFNGNGAGGIVVPLNNENTSLIEALAMAGGLNERARANRVKVFRKVSGKQEVYMVDLSTVEGIRYSSFAMQSGDVVYVEPMPRVGQEALRIAQPYVTLVGTFLLVWRFFGN